VDFAVSWEGVVLSVFVPESSVDLIMACKKVSGWCDIGTSFFGSGLRAVVRSVSRYISS